jgi:thymidylate synthase (FAD)
MDIQEMEYGWLGAMQTEDIEAQVALAASVSSGVDPKNAGKLNRKLIELGHLTPLEAIQFNFHVSGISKAAGAQISRHRIGQGHVSKSRRFQNAEMAYVYPLLEKVKDREQAKYIYRRFENLLDLAHLEYINLRDKGLNKTDARLLLPVASATERTWWINARAMRDFFALRLPADAESEIRRLAYMLLDIVYNITPSLFEDIKEKYAKR